VTPEREHRAGALFLTAIELGSAERDRLLLSIELEDPALRAQVEALLGADERNADGFLRAPIADSVLNELEKSVAARAHRGTDTGHIGAYRVIKELGRGEHAVVYLAEQDQPVHRRVAIKVLLAGSESAEIVRRFETERRILALMEHPNIARLFEAGVTPDGDAYFVMEHVDGGPISAFCRDGSLSVRQRMELFCQVCRAVEHAHQRGIIHRDLKPTNILVSKGSGGEPSVKVIDFGVARATGAGVYSFPSHTLHGQVVGTIGYMSPEQIGGDGSLVDTRSDVYGLGAVLYELLCESPAIVTLDAGPATVITRITVEGPRPAGSLRQALRGDLEIIISKAMEKEPSRRYPSVAALREDVERYLSSRPIAARAPSAAYLARRFASRHRRPVVMAMVLGVLVAAGAARVWRAEHAKFDIAVEIARSYIDDSRHMAKTAGERERRRPLLKRLGTQSESLLLRAPTHQGVMRMRADVLGAMGDMALEDGKIQEAKALFETAVALREHLAKGSPTSLDYQMDLSVAIVRLGDAFKDLGDKNAAQECYDRAWVLDEDSVDKAPQSARAVTLLAWSYDRLASIAADRGKLSFSDALFDDGLRLMKTLNTLETSPDACRGLSVAHGHVGATALRLGDIPTYREHVLSSLEHAEAAVRLEPGDRLAHWAHLSARLRFAGAFNEVLGPQVAAEYALETLDRAAQLAKLDPTDEPIHGCYIGAMECAADFVEADGDAMHASVLRRSQVEESQRYLDMRPDDPEAKIAYTRAVELQEQFIARQGVY